MSEKFIPEEIQKEVKDFNAKQTDPDAEIDNAFENAESEEITKMKAWKKPAEQTTGEPESKSGLLTNMSKKAGKWLKGAFTAGALMAGTESYAKGLTQEQNSKIEQARSAVEKSSEQRLKRMEAEKNDEKIKLTEIKNLIVSAVEKKYPGMGKIMDEECDNLLNNLEHESFLNKLNALDLLGKGVLNDLKKTSEKKYNNDWKGEVEKRTDEAVDHYEHMKAAFKIFFDKSVPYEKALAALEKEMEPGVAGNLNGLNFERKKDGRIFLNYTEVTPHSRASMVN